MTDSFFNFVAEQLEKEEKERRQKAENGEIVRGKDTILIWGNKYVIGHYYDSNHFETEENGISDTILANVKKYKVKKKKLYILSEEGYAVTDKSNICRVFILGNSGMQYSEGEFVNDEQIQYLSSYDDFSSEEKSVFEKLERTIKESD